MKLSYLALSLLGSLVVAQSLIEDDCQCPQVKCPATDTLKGCRCVNLAELRCKQRCPNYMPTKFRICRRPKQASTAPASEPTPALPEPSLSSSLSLPDVPLVPGCECEEMMCIQSYPDSCHCAYGIAKNCYKKCGGKSPGPNTCPPLNPPGSGPFDGPVKRAAAPEPKTLQVCTRPIKPTPTKRPIDPSRRHRVCGGGRGNTNPPCPTGYICMNDPYKSGCGLECDGTGICVKDELCGGFAGFRCPDLRQICVDKPDDCDPENGGADCGGVCVWPPALRIS